MGVSDIIQEQDQMLAHMYHFTLWPHKWQQYQNLKLPKWTVHRLIKSQKKNIPNQSGIYTLLVQPGICNHPACSFLMYVGQTNSLQRRFNDYLTKERRELGRPKIFRLLNKYSDNIWFCYIPVPETELNTIEDALNDAYSPPCNDKVPAAIGKVRGAFS